MPFEVKRNQKKNKIELYFVTKKQKKYRDWEWTEDG